LLSLNYIILSELAAAHLGDRLRNHLGYANFVWRRVGLTSVWNAKMRNLKRTLGLLGAVLLAASGTVGSNEAQAAESAQGVYVLGNRGPLAGVTPPPGFYFESETYYYSGNLGGGRTFQSGGVVAANVKLDFSANFMTPIWVTPVEILGGNLGFSITIPFGTPNVSAGTVLFSPRIDRIIAGRERDANFNVGDIYLASFVGWHSGNFHWSGTLLGVVPSGSYESGQLSNISLNRPALISAARSPTSIPSSVTSSRWCRASPSTGSTRRRSTSRAPSSTWNGPRRSI